MPEQVGLPPSPIWPFPATQEITEVLEWRTDVLPSRAGEQRIALRPRPREIVTLRTRDHDVSVPVAVLTPRPGR